MKTKKKSKGRDFRHTCTNCGTNFTGRKNKKYCTDVCKINYNNDRLAERNLEKKSYIHSQAQAFVRNWQILNELVELGCEKIPVKSLIKKGFDFDAPSNLVLAGEPDTIIRRYWKFLLKENVTDGICTIKSILRIELKMSHTFVPDL